LKSDVGNLRCKLSNNPFFFAFFLALLCRASTDSGSPSQTRSASQSSSSTDQQPCRNQTDISPPNIHLVRFLSRASWSGYRLHGQFFPNSLGHAIPRNSHSSSADQHQPGRPQAEDSPPSSQFIHFFSLDLGRSSTVGGSFSRTRLSCQPNTCTLFQQRSAAQQAPSREITTKQSLH
jgi:hypothetical protein